MANLHFIVRGRGSDLSKITTVEAKLGPRRNVFIAGATGYMGSRLAAELVRRGHSVTGLVRATVGAPSAAGSSMASKAPGAARRLPEGCRQVVGDALNRATFSAGVACADTYVQLVGVAHPSPSKAREFRAIDMKSCEESVAAAMANRVRHFVYVSVAHPAAVMKAYIEVRTRCEEIIRESGLNATILRPWYVLGPGHYWPYLLVPAYWVGRQIPSLRESAIRLGLVTVKQMVAALVAAVEAPATGIRVVEVPEIKAA